MTKISNQYSLTNVLTADTVNNRLGINNGSPTVALDVTGAGKFSSSVTNAGLFFNTNDTPQATAGTITKHSVVGLTMRGITGSAFDYSLYSAAGTALIANIAGTNTISFPNGNVGIGTTSPASLLHIKGVDYSILTLDAATGFNSQLRFYINGGLYSAITALSNENALVMYHNGAERMRITSDSKVLFGTSTYGAVGVSINNFGAGIFNVFGTGYWAFIEFKNNNGSIGSITGSGTTTSYNTTSDYRLKEDLKPINGLEKVSAIKVYDYKWKASDSRMDGVLAHELQEVLPYAVNGVKDGEQMQGVDYSKIVPVMVKAIQELSADLTSAKQEIELLKAK
jgi:hypothetical protein